MASPKHVGGGGMSPSRVTLMERQALEKGDVSMLATLRIGELDKLVAKMKQRKATCLAAVAQYEKEIAHIDTEAKNIAERYAPLCKRLEQRREERAQLQQQVAGVAKQFGDILSSTKRQLRASTHERVQHIRLEASLELAGARGYALGKESTVYQRTSALRPAAGK
ncbi:hypothetical protein PybrP1_004734 [[Pythium] brassicae (nom. inval.)]|nr:hypothetical protein PybrP1_004734 [[Pythium] brassicae (nom. inval.)]